MGFSRHALFQSHWKILQYNFTWHSPTPMFHVGGLKWWSLTVCVVWDCFFPPTFYCKYFQICRKVVKITMNYLDSAILNILSNLQNIHVYMNITLLNYLEVAAIVMLYLLIFNFKVSWHLLRLWIFCIITILLSHLRKLTEIP